MEKVEKKEKVEKPVKKSEKYIWLALSAVIAFVGYICRSNAVLFPTWLKILFAALLMFTIVMAAQKTSVERLKYNGENGSKKKYILISILYYIFILIAVAYVFLSLWVSCVLSI
jgi:uncharacterized membrane protein YhaH (DUF805 family)